jgi:hypothetical protein
MAEPKKLLETALFGLLDAALSCAVYNTRAAGSTFNYVVFQAAGGDDDWYLMKKRGHVYDYQVVAVHTDRSAALDLNATLDGAMAGAMAGTLSVSGYGVVSVARVDPVDYTQVLEDGQMLHYVGGVYRIELEEV